MKRLNDYIHKASLYFAQDENTPFCPSLTDSSFSYTTITASRVEDLPRDLAPGTVVRYIPLPGSPPCTHPLNDSNHYYYFNFRRFFDIGEIITHDELRHLDSYVTSHLKNLNVEVDRVVKLIPRYMTYVVEHDENPLYPNSPVVYILP
jgi:hypothetical protein